MDPSRNPAAATSAELNRQMRIVSNVDLPKTFWISIDPKSPVAHLNGTGYLNGTLEYLRFIENPNFDVTTMSQHFLTAPTTTSWSTTQR